MEIHIDPTGVSSPEGKRRLSLLPKRFATVMSALMLACMCWSIVETAWLAAGIALLSAVLIYPCSRLGWRIGEALRDLFAPDAVVTAGVGDLVKQRLFWLVGPQAIFALVPLLIGIGFWVGPHEAVARPKRDSRHYQAVEARNKADRAKLVVDPVRVESIHAQLVSLANAAGLPCANCLANDVLAAEAWAQPRFPPVFGSWDYPLPASLAKLDHVPMRVALTFTVPSEEQLNQLLVRAFWERRWFSEPSPVAAGDSWATELTAAGDNDACRQEIQNIGEVKLRKIVFSRAKLLFLKLRPIGHPVLREGLKPTAEVWDAISREKGEDWVWEQMRGVPFANPTLEFQAEWFRMQQRAP